jgi:hypothetical protein
MRTLRGARDVCADRAWAGGDERVEQLAVRAEVQPHSGVASIGASAQRSRPRRH